MHEDEKTAAMCEFAVEARGTPRGVGGEKFPSGNLLVAESLKAQPAGPDVDEWLFEGLIFADKF